MRALAAVLLAALSFAPPQGEEGLAKAARFLWSKQAEDGGWHSGTYGLLRSGQSLTPFVLAALLEVPREVEPAPEGAVARAVDFILRHVERDGALGRSDPLLDDYPNYATALATVVLAKGGKDPARLVACLRRHQFQEDLGWTPDHPAYGAWGMGGPLRRPPHAGHVDLSMTRHVLEALSAAGAKADDPALERAKTWLARCRNADGGFHFSAVVTDANKAGREAKGFRSYGTATADGLLALVAAGLGKEDPNVAGTREWLVGRHRVDRVPGFVAEAPDWAGGMLFYYLAASARAFRDAGVEEAPRGQDWRGEMSRALAGRQAKDGSFMNSCFLMKEDDPLIATSLAVSALAACRR